MVSSAQKWSSGGQVWTSEGSWQGDNEIVASAGLGATTKAVTKDEDKWKEFWQKEVDCLRVQAM